MDLLMLAVIGVGLAGVVTIGAAWSRQQRDGPRRPSDDRQDGYSAGDSSWTGEDDGGWSSGSDRSDCDAGGGDSGGGDGGCGDGGGSDGGGGD